MKKSTKRVFSLLPIVTGLSLAIGSILDFGETGNGHHKVSGQIKVLSPGGKSEMIGVASANGFDRVSEKIETRTQVAELEVVDSPAYDHYLRMSQSTSEIAWAGETEILDAAKDAGDDKISEKFVARHSSAGIEMLQGDPAVRYSKMSKKIKEIALTGDSEMVDVIVRYRDELGQTELVRIAKLGGKNQRAFEKLKMTSIRIPASKLEALADGMDVQLIMADTPVEASSLAARQTAKLPKPGTPSSVQVDPNLAVAVLDSGVADHVDLNVANRMDCTQTTAGESQTYRDEFNITSYDNSDGTVDWSANPWIEISDNGSPRSGDIAVEVDNCPDRGSRCIEIDADGLNDSVEREVDLSEAVAATLTFDYRLDDSDAEFILEISTDGGSSWDSQPLAVYANSALVFGETFDLSGYISANTRIRFRTINLGDAHLRFDNLQISYERPAESCSVAQAGKASGVSDGILRDEFNTISFAGNDGSVLWAGDWVEGDVAGVGPKSGNVIISNGELLLDDHPNTGTQPSAARAVNLSQATSATLGFDFRTGPGVDAVQDKIAVDISNDGGSSYSTLEIIENYSGGALG